MRGKECENFLLQRVQIESARCDTVLAESAEIRDTCIRPRGCVCGSMVFWSHAHTRIQLSAMQHQSSSQRVGALLIHRLAWVDQHTFGSRLRPTVHRCPKGMAVGGPCDQTAQQYSAETPRTLPFFLLPFFSSPSSSSPSSSSPFSSSPFSYSPFSSSPFSSSPFSPPFLPPFLPFFLFF